jgi:threonine dehydrogenase-like Zn-dependent dehydrogenase
VTAAIADAAIAALPPDGDVDVTGEGELATALRSRLATRLAREAERAPAAVIDTTGDPTAIAAALARLDDLGTLVLAGPAAPQPGALDLYADLHVRGLTVVGIAPTG